MGLFEQAPGYYQPQEFNYSDFETYNQLLGQYKQKEATLRSSIAREYPQVSARIQALQQELDNLAAAFNRCSPIALSQLSLQSAFRDALQTIKSNVMLSPIATLCGELIQLNARSLPTEAVLEQMISRYSTLEERQPGDDNSKWIDYIRYLIQINVHNYQLTTAPDFNDRVLAQYTQPSAPPAPQGSLYPELTSDQPQQGAMGSLYGGLLEDMSMGMQGLSLNRTDYESPLARASAPFIPDDRNPYAPMQEQIASLSASNTVHEHYDVLSGGYVAKQVKDIKSKTDRLLTEDTLLECSALSTLCDSILFRVEHGKSVTVTNIQHEIDKLDTLKELKSSSPVYALFTELKQNLNIDVQPKVAQSSVFAAHRRFLEAASSVGSIRGKEGRNAAIEKLLTYLDAYIADRATIVDKKSGKTLEYVRGGGFFTKGQNSFSQEKNAVEHIRALLRGDLVLTKDDITVLGFSNVVTGASGPLKAINKFIAECPAQVRALLDSENPTADALLSALAAAPGAANTFK